MTTRSALIVGASGLVGQYLLKRLLASENYGEVISLGRRKLELTDTKLRQEIVDFASLEKLSPFPTANDAFCCLGTTIKKAGSEQAFFAIDHDAVVSFARTAKASGAEQFLHVTALGASAKSSIFYNRVKAQTEDDVTKLGYACTIAFRPSMLDGERQESRIGERIGLAVMKVFRPILGKYRPTHGDTVAAAMVKKALEKPQGNIILEANEIEAIAK